MIQFGKRIEVLIGNRRITQHEIRFDCQLSLTSEPDEADVTILNLSAEDRGAIESAGRDAQVVIYAGYKAQDPLPSIFLGRLRRVTTHREGPDLLTKVEAATAIRAREYGRQLNRVYRAGTQVKAVVRDLLEAAEVGEGNLRGVLDTLQLDGVGSLFSAPVSVQGPAWESLVQILEASGFTVTTQGDQLVAIGVRNALQRTAVRLDAGTGLRGEPSVDAKGRVTAQAAMISEIVPGRKVQIASERVNGEFKATRVQYRGSLYGAEFGLTLEGRPVQQAGQAR